MKSERQRAIDRIADDILLYQANHRTMKPIRLYISTALYKLIAGEKWEAQLKRKMFDIEVKCFNCNELEYSICEVVKRHEMFL